MTQSQVTITSSERVKRCGRTSAIGITATVALMFKAARAFYLTQLLLL